MPTPVAEPLNLVAQSQLLLALRQLDPDLAEPRFVEYWPQLLALLQQPLATPALSLSFCQPFHSAPPRSPVRMGQLDQERVNLLAEAEAGWPHPGAHESTGCTVLTVGNQQLRQLPLWLSGQPQALLTWLVEPGSPASAESDALLALVQLVIERALRTQALYETQRQHERAMYLHRVVQAVTSSLDLNTIFHQTTELAAHGLQAQAATLFQIDWERHELLFLITKGAAAQILEEKRMPLARGVAGWVALNGRTQIVNDPQSASRFNPEVDAQTGFKTHNILCAPLRIHERTVGVIEVLNKNGAGGFTQDDADWLETLGRQIAIAMHNAQTYQSLRADQERLIKAQEAVRHHLARELHDNAAQLLGAISLHLEVARLRLNQAGPATVEKELDQAQALARQANREIRTLLFELHPLILESQGLIPALYAYHRQLQNSLPCTVHLEVEPPARPVTPAAASAIFSIIQEAVNNIRKHAHAQQIWISVTTHGADLHFAVEDDGSGFVVEQVAQSYDESGSLGLHNMHERARLIQAQLQIFSPRPGSIQGTLVRGIAPLATITSAASPTFR
jgi:signal transduction histidine kinase